MDQDEFAYMFEAMFGEGGRRRPGGRNTESTIPYEVTLEELYAGKSVKMNMTRNVRHGSRIFELLIYAFRLYVCNATGEDHEIALDSRSLSNPCQSSGSKSKAVKTKCSRCEGTGLVTVSRLLERGKVEYAISSCYSVLTALLDWCISYRLSGL